MATPEGVTLNLASLLDTIQLAQYTGAVKLNAFMNGWADLLQEKIVDVMLKLDRRFNVDEATESLLDGIASWYGITRPQVSASAEFFGFEGTQAVGGRTFGQAPFYTPPRGLESVEPISDVWFKPIVKARILKVRSTPSREHVESILNVLFGNGYMSSGRPKQVTIHVETERNVLYNVVSGSYFELLIPTVPGFVYTWNRTDP